jgi:hypothetical protein
MAEAKLKELGTTHEYMDNDSVFVPPEKALEITEFFQSLNPYNIGIQLLKPEKENLWFYGISSKRYALYYYENEKISFMEKRSYMLHGLGHLTNPFPKAVKDWHGEIWQDILKLHYGQTTEDDIEEKYSSFSAISQLTVTTSNVLRKFKKLNKESPGKSRLSLLTSALLALKHLKKMERLSSL